MKPPVPAKKGKGAKNHSRNSSRESQNIEPFDVTQILSLHSMASDELDEFAEEF